jgi:hypothetical protein
MKKFLLPVLAVAVFMTACVPSLQPLYTPETIVFREELAGIWKGEPQKEESWTFTKGENNVYRLNIRDKEDSSLLEARLVKLGDYLFLDLFPDGSALEASKLGEFYRAALVPGHLILQVKLGAKLELRLMEAESLAEMLKANPKALAHTFVPEERLVITASTAELQAFMKKHAENEDLWGNPAEMQKLVL